MACHLVEQRREPTGELELDVAGEHADEHVRADAVLEAVVHGADLKRGLHRLKRALVDLQLLVSAHDRAGADPLLGLAVRIT